MVVARWIHADGRAKVDGQEGQFSAIAFLLSPYWHALVSILAGQANDDFLLNNGAFQRSYSSEIVHPMKIVESSTSERSLATMSKKRVKYRLCAKYASLLLCLLSNLRSWSLGPPLPLDPLRGQWTISFLSSPSGFHLLHCIPHPIPCLIPLHTLV